MKVKQPGVGLQFDPICGRRLGIEPVSGLSSEFKKRKYFFCSERCRRAFEHHAEKLRLHELARVGALLSPWRVCWGLG
jgi:YHS domain-containing protein